jgi:hypothetical protein
VIEEDSGRSELSTLCRQERSIDLLGERLDVASANPARFEVFLPAIDRCDDDTSLASGLVFRQPERPHIDIAFASVESACSRPTRNYGVLIKSM